MHPDMMQYAFCHVTHVRHLPDMTDIRGQGLPHWALALPW